MDRRTKQKLTLVHKELGLASQGVELEDFLLDPFMALRELTPNKEWAREHRTTPTKIANKVFPYTGPNGRATQLGNAEHQRHDEASKKYQRMN